jgi:hypothetical protein
MDDADLARLIGERAGTYWPGAAGVAQARILAVHQRPTTRLVRIAIERPGGSPRTVIVKRSLPASQSHDANRPSRPRIAPIIDPPTRDRLEYEALLAIDRELSARPDPGIAPIHVHDRLDDGSIVMDLASGKPLSALLARSGRVVPPPARPNLDAPFANAGRWLRRFQQLEGLAPAGARLATRAAVVEAIAGYADYLVPRIRTGTPLQRLAGATIDHAERRLPADLDLGLGHGDFAMRNIIVASGQSVAVLDTRARWMTCVAEDPATLLVALRTNRMQSLTRGAALSSSLLARWERAFLDGWLGGQPLDRILLRVFEVLVLLDKWASLVDRPRWIGRWLEERHLGAHLAGLVGHLASDGMSRQSD